MTNQKKETSPGTLARTAGFLYLLLIPLGIFGILYVPSTLIVQNDAAATINNIKASEGLFRLSIVSAFLVQLVNIVVVLVLFKLLKPVSKTWAKLMVIFLLVAVPIAMLNELNNFAVLLLLSGASYASGFTAAQLQNLVMFFLSLHEHGILIAGIFWGIWLFPMGYLVFKSGFLPKILGILLMIGCLGYVTDSLTHFLFPTYVPTVSPIATTPSAIAEFSFVFWLLIKGVNVQKWKKRAQEST